MMPHFEAVVHFTALKGIPQPCVTDGIPIAQKNRIFNGRTQPVSGKSIEPIIIDEVWLIGDVGLIAVNVPVPETIVHQRCIELK